MSKFRQFLKRNKKAMMGVSTLIIFISAILTSAVAAAVIVRTVGILQERAFTVTTEIRDRIVTALDFISVNGYANVSAQKMYGFDILTRTRSGSYSYSLLTAGLTFTNEKVTAAAQLQHSENEDYGEDNDGLEITNLTTSWYMLPDMDDDMQQERMRLMTDVEGNNEIIFFQFSQGETANFSLNEDFDGGSTTISINDTPIIGDEGTWYGFVQLQGETGFDGGDYWLSMGQNETSYFRITHYPELDWCDFSRLIPETAYCYQTRVGNGDPAVAKGEIYILKYKLKPQHYQDPDEPFQIKMIPKKGDYTSINGNSPDSFTKELSQIWPVSSGG